MNENTIEKYHLHKDEPNKLQFEIFSSEDDLAEFTLNAQKPHSHSFYEIIWFTKGIGKHYVDFKEYNVEDNSIFFISKGQIHHYDDNHQEGFIILFNESFLDTFDNPIDVFLKYNIFYSFKKEPFFRIKELDGKNLHCIIKQIQIEMQTPDLFGHSSYLKGLLHMFLILIQRFGKRKDSQELIIKSPSYILYMNFRNYLEDNFCKIRTVAEYANKFNVSTKTLTNCTKEISRQTPLEIINERIILEARRLLAYSERNVNEIGYELGFEDPSYFVKFFKRYMKISPRDFRKNIF